MSRTLLAALATCAMACSQPTSNVQVECSNADCTDLVFHAVDADSTLDTIEWHVFEGGTPLSGTIGTPYETGSDTYALNGIGPGTYAVHLVVSRLGQSSESRMDLAASNMGPGQDIHNITAVKLDSTVIEPSALPGPISSFTCGSNVRIPVTSIGGCVVGPVEFQFPPHASSVFRGPNGPHDGGFADTIAWEIGPQTGWMNQQMTQPDIDLNRLYQMPEYPVSVYGGEFVSAYLNTPTGSNVTGIFAHTGTDPEFGDFSFTVQCDGSEGTVTYQNL